MTGRSDAEWEKRLSGQGDGTHLSRFKTARIEAKERKAAEAGPSPDRGASEGRLPPGQHRTEDFPVLDLGVRPLIDVRDWQLSIKGRVERPVDLSWDDFRALDQSAITSDIHCVTDWSRYDNQWRGVSGVTLMNLVRPLKEAAYLIIHCHDGYTTNLPLQGFLEPHSLVATHWNGRPLAREHGGPVRVVVPSLYFWKSAKWIKHILVSDRDVKGFWETRGYHNDGDPWKEQRYG
ncbi:MAG: sulfite oxidase-like oxidoreductase [Magnetovibrionaceae bacterium]